MGGEKGEGPAPGARQVQQSGKRALPVTPDEPAAPSVVPDEGPAPEPEPRLLEPLAVVPAVPPRVLPPVLPVLPLPAAAEPVVPAMPEPIAAAPVLPPLLNVLSPTEPLVLVLLSAPALAERLTQGTVEPVAGLPRALEPAAEPAVPVVWATARPAVAANAAVPASRRRCFAIRVILESL